MPLRLVVLQTAPALGRVADNVAHHATQLTDADLILTPELALTGYAVRDRVHELAVPLEIGSPPPHPVTALAPRDGPAIVVGLVERGRDGVPYNAAVLFQHGVVRHVHRKVYLPTYGVFEEGRWFGRGDRVEVVELAGGWRAAILVCEDLWHPALPYLAAAAGADLLLVAAAAPGRGVIEAEAQERNFASEAAWTELVRVTARSHGMYVALANRCGVEDGILFAGGSCVVGPDGTILAAASHWEEQRLDVALEPDELNRCRTPYAHWRDEDPRLLARGLERLGIGA